MIRLVPSWAHHYEAFWLAVKRRNSWFIRLRYFFILLLVVFLTGGELVLSFNLTPVQVTGIVTVILFIFSYNLLLQKVRKKVSCIPGRFNCLHLSLVQMLLDLCSLMVLVFFTGIIESPLHMFFIFQMIIGSLILPGYVVYSIASVTILVYGILIILQYTGQISTLLIQGLYVNYSPHNFSYIVLFMLVFASMMLVSVMLANRIARSLYKREQELRETLDKLNELETAKQKYIMGVVHEIKSPIAAVQSIIDLIINDFLGPVSDEIKAKLIKAKKRSQDSLELINNVLRLSKLKLLNITSSEELDIKEMITDVAEQHSEEAKNKNIDVRILAEENKYILHSDKILLELAFSNIIGNAVKYNLEKGNIEITIKQVNGNIIIEICDDGIGIPAEDIAKVFQQFYRAKNVKSQEFEGSGLGLALVKEIIERLGGEMSLESPSRLGKEGRPGTVFYVLFPLEFSAPVNNEKEKTLAKAI